MITAEEARKNVEIYKKYHEIAYKMLNDIDSNINEQSLHGLTSHISSLAFDDYESMAGSIDIIKIELEFSGFSVNFTTYNDNSASLNVSW